LDDPSEGSDQYPAKATASISFHFHGMTVGDQVVLDIIDRISQLTPLSAMIGVVDLTVTQQAHRSPEALEGLVRGGVHPRHRSSQSRGIVVVHAPLKVRCISP